MRIHVLGAGAGGGFPQWNCNCRNCAGLRAGTLKARARTQSSIAIGDDEGHWLLCNASPDILTQLQHFPGAQPARALRDTALAGVLLIDAQIDHSTGLYMLREHREKLALWCTQPVYEDLTQGNPILRLLAHYCSVDWHCLQADGRSFTVPQLPSLRFAAIPLISNAPPYSPHRDRPVPGDNIGLLVEDIRSGGRLFYAPGLGVMQPAVLDAMCSADVVLVDGTCWQDDELIALGISHKTAREMGHLPQSGEQGMLAQLARLPARTRRILIHINNTNPILDEDSAEHAQLRAQGVELAHDCMEFSL